MLIFAVETSCDETCAAVVAMPERKILSNAVASQIEVHALYGGVVPEIASRAHAETISRIAYAALADAGVSIGDIDAVAVTNEPGLIGALLVGVNFAKSLAYGNNLPLIAVNHIYGHAAAAYLAFRELEPPFLACVVSGGHTTLFKVSSPLDYAVLGRSRDDAAGEAFDKVGRVMGLSYPCGAEMDRLAAAGFASGVKYPSFPSPAIPGDTLDMSFSGLKTAVINYLNTEKQRGADVDREAVAAGFTLAATDGLCRKLSAALVNEKIPVVLAGGVAANTHLRAAVNAVCTEAGVKPYAVPPFLCGDNAAMIAAQGYYEFTGGRTADTSLNGRAW